ncbi:LamG-like jellyroll fold domain-containing protein [Streptomyces odonnellii]|uniref:LamG-like jellyroll fold domain-containing protein n=1 Tax=Streptomyces odonnellii TaxID=1417980 RepID=UPI0038CD6F11
MSGLLSAAPALAVAPDSTPRPASDAAAGPATASGPGAGTEEAALAEARRTGKDVEVTALRSETGEVFAKPNGRMEAVEHLRPVRARVGGEWRNIDTSLRKRPDGSLAPAVATVGIAFSGGGATAPLIALERAGRELSLSWPTALPEPVIDGSTATYPSVLPDVDLQVRADTDGISQILVVKSAEAGADPRLASLRMAVDADGMTVKETPDGGLVATDQGSGGPVFEAQQPLMWDSSIAAGTETASAKTAPLTRRMKQDTARSAVPAEDQGAPLVPGESAKVAPIGVDVAAGGDSLVLTPDRELLKNATYPVYIDPQWYSPKASNWTMASRYWASSPQWRFNGDSDAGMGYCAGDARCAPEDVKRLFYAIPTSQFAGKTILSAEFVVRETHSYSCDKTDVQLWRTKGISKTTTWNSQLADGFWVDLLQTRSEAKGYSGTCPGGDIEFWALRAVQQAAANGWSTTTFGLMAKSETDRYSWKRFSDDAYLRVQYNKPPAQIKMSQLTQDPGGSCSSTARRVRILPTLRANDVTDPDGDSVAVQFQGTWDSGDGKGRIVRWTSARSSFKKSGSDFTVPMPSSITKNVAIGWHARSYDGAQWSPWSYAGSATDCVTVYDTSVPAAPRIASGEYPPSDAENPDDPWHDGVGRYGTFTIDATQTDVTKYWFGVNANPTSAHTLATSGGVAKTTTFMPTKPGVNFITAQAFDAAGNGSSVATYYFRVRAGQPDRLTMDLDEPAGSTAVSGQGGAWPAGLSGGASAGGEGVTGGALHLNGVDGEATTVSPVLNTSKSFSVSLWAKLPGTDQGRPMTAVAQAGNNTHGLEIYYSSALGGWSFLRQTSDAASGAGAVRATQPACPAGDTACAQARVSRWTHLVGVYDKVTNQLRLYVDGKLVATSPYSAADAWDARRSLHLGASHLLGRAGGYFAGDLDDVRLFDYPLTDAQVTTVNSGNPVTTGRPAKAVWTMDEGATATSVTGRGQRVTANLHGGTVLGGAGAQGSALAFNGTDAYAQTGQSVLDTYQSFSVSLWARLPKDKADKAMTIAAQGGKEQSGFEIYHSSAYGGWVFVRANEDTATSVYARAVYAACPAHTNCAAGGLGEWSHIVGVHDMDANEIRLYVNGVLRATTPFTGRWNATGPLTLGAAPYPTGVGGFFQGDLDDTRLYDRVISDAEIKDLFAQRPVIKARWKLESASGSPAVSPDASPGNRPVTLYNGASTGGGWVDSGALQLDGQDDYAATASVPIDTSQSFTVTAWALAPSGRPETAATVLSQEGAVNSGFMVKYAPATATEPAGWRIEMPKADTAGAAVSSAANAMFDDWGAGGWNHLALVHDAFADEMRLYVNGQLEQTACDDGTVGEGECADDVSWASDVTAFNATKSLQIGRSKTAGVWGGNWSGSIDDVWAFQGTLSQDQIQQLAMGAADLPTKVPGA